MKYLGCFVAAIVGILAVALSIFLLVIICKALFTSYLGILAAGVIIGLIVLALLLR